MHSSSRTFLCKTCGQLFDDSGLVLDEHGRRLCGDQPICRGVCKQISELGKMDFLERIFGEVNKLPNSLKQRLLAAAGASL